MSSMGELTFFLGLQVMQRDDGIFISQDKYVADILKKFDFFIIKTTSTSIKTNKALLKDEEAKEVDVHLYRSMIGSLMCLTASRPDIMFAVCACARFQVIPKVSHLHAIKRIFRYLKGQPKLGLWYPRDSPFNLEAFSDSDYAGASLDRKSTTGGCQFLAKRLISWQCKKQTVVANSTTEKEYVATANCCRQVLWIQNQMLDYGFNFMNTKIYIDNESTICIVKNPVFHSKTKHIKIRHHFIRDSYEKKLIQVIKIHTDHNVVDLLTKDFNVSRKSKRTNEISKSSGPIPLVTDETVIKEWEDRMQRAATTASSLEAEQDSGNINRTQSMATLNESFPQGADSVNTLRSGEDNMKLKELTEFCTQLSELVIVNGDAPTIALASAGTEAPMKFHGIKDAKTLWEEIKAIFKGNKELKKMQKIILKQQYENFAASRSEGLDKTYDRFQKLISQLEIHDTLSMDNLYDNLKVYEYEIKGQSSSNSQNVAFLSSKNTSSTNEAVNTAHEVSTASSQGQVSSSTYADDVMFSFFANQSNSGNAYHKGEKILKEDRKESDFQW
ncbi:hypothetical protein Tco_0990036 [Tanacetum coccineum]|uniref:Uncharacterized protein n=1 Tax=Tanacetum coccineum TaxID=301880 RepID=A0ABQ5EWS6_9ASTR